MTNRSQVPPAKLPEEDMALGKYEQVREILKQMGRVALAFSGGTDSTLLLQAAKSVLGNRILAINALSETTPEHEKEGIEETARILEAAWLRIFSSEMEDPDFVANSPERCYFCKKIRFGEILKIAQSRGFDTVIDGTNIDDDRDYRPGMRAVRELGIRSPLREAGLTKSEIRFLSQKLGLATWNKPSEACLASRIPFHQPITVQKLRQADAAENILRAVGLCRQVRVRHEGHTARIEVMAQDMIRLTESSIRMQIVAGLRSLGFSFVCLDLEGYQTGSMNRLL